MKREISFRTEAFDEYADWVKIDKKSFNKITKLIKEIQRSPFEGTGSPEPLKYKKSGYWSRRITKEHRLVYEVRSDVIIIYSCKGHYVR